MKQQTKTTKPRTKTSPRKREAAIETETKPIETGTKPIETGTKPIDSRETEGRGGYGQFNRVTEPKRKHSWLNGMTVHFIYAIILSFSFGYLYDFTQSVQKTATKGITDAFAAIDGNDKEIAKVFCGLQNQVIDIKTAQDEIKKKMDAAEEAIKLKKPDGIFIPEDVNPNPDPNMMLEVMRWGNAICSNYNAGVTVYISNICDLIDTRTGDIMKLLKDPEKHDPLKRDNLIPIMDILNCLNYTETALNCKKRIEYDLANKIESSYLLLKTKISGCRQKDFGTETYIICKAIFLKFKSLYERLDMKNTKINSVTEKLEVRVR